MGNVQCYTTEKLNDSKKLKNKKEPDTTLNSEKRPFEMGAKKDVSNNTDSVYNCNKIEEISAKSPEKITKVCKENDKVQLAPLEKVIENETQNIDLANGNQNVHEQVTIFFLCKVTCTIDDTVILNLLV